MMLFKLSVIVTSPRAFMAVCKSDEMEGFSAAGIDGEGRALISAERGVEAEKTSGRRGRRRKRLSRLRGLVVDASDADDLDEDERRIVLGALLLSWSRWTRGIPSSGAAREARLECSTSGVEGWALRVWAGRGGACWRRGEVKLSLKSSR